MANFRRFVPSVSFLQPLTITEEAAINQILKINHVGLRIRSLEATREFYQKIGFQFVAGPLGPEPVAIMEHPSGISINFILNATQDAPAVNLLMDVAAKPTGYTHIALEVNDLRAVETQIQTAGIEITEAVSLPNGAECFFVRDPDHNVLEFHQPA